MKNNIRRKLLESTICLMLSVFCLFLSAKAQKKFGTLENQPPANWKASSESTLTISDKHYKHGKESLEWKWKAGSVITVNNSTDFADAAQKYKGGIMLWIYNTEPINEQLKFEFLAGGIQQYYFNFNLNYKGWRACWLRFNEDMYGSKSNKFLNAMKITAPDYASGGKIFFDRLKFPDDRINDRLTPDAQLAYINPKMNQNHWAALYYWNKNLSWDIDLTEPTDAEKTELQTIFQRVENEVKGETPSASSIADAKNKFNTYNIKISDGIISGLPFLSEDESENNELKFSNICPVLYTLASAYHHNNDIQAEIMAVYIIRHLMDQGLAVNSGMGTNHHYGYYFRRLASSIFLLKDALKENKIYEEVLAVILYWTGVQEFREMPKRGVSMDALNTTLFPRLVAIMTMDNEQEKLRAMKGLKRWFSNALKPSPGTVGAIKIDGTGFHHGGFYPAYSMGGYKGAAKCLKQIKGTSFEPDAEAISSFAKALFTARIYSNKDDWGFGISGRHPLQGSIKKIIPAFAILSQASDNEEEKKKLAEAYLRLETKNTAWKQDFESKGWKAEKSPNGFWSFNYGALGIYRREDWQISIKGYNNNVWSSEIYSADNRYGRYQSYGTVQVMYEAGREASAYNEDGWDWNRYPGATSVHLPFDKLESPRKKTVMAKTDETFAGASSLKGEYGIFAQIIHENLTLKNYNPDHRARKSVFCFGNKIICLASGIENSNSAYETETTLFQNYISENTKPIWINSNIEINSTSYSKELDNNTSNFIIDAVGTGYYIPKGNTVQIQRKLQQSKHNKTKKKTEGFFASAWIKHGKAPKNQTYEYVLLPKTDFNKISTFAKKMNNPQTALYTVLQKDNTAHIIEDKESKTIAYAIFEANKDFDKGKLKHNSAACLVMMQTNEEGKITMSVCDPDLHLPEDNYETTKESEETKIQLLIKGRWKIESENPKCRKLGEQDGNSLLEFDLQHASPQEIILSYLGEIPEIIGQNERTYINQTVIDIDINDLIVEDSDSNFPADFTLEIQASDQYEATGNSIKLKEGITGKIYVPIIVSDGYSKSSVYNLEINILTHLFDNKPNNKISIYPNPASDSFIVENYNPKPYMIMLFSQDGKCVLSQITEQRLLEINTKKFAKGTYNIKIKNDKNIYSTKIIFQ